jgi:beta-lactamase class C
VDYARLEQRIATLMQEPDMVGLAIGTVEDGQVRFVRGYGEVLAGSGQAVTPDTVFRWGSVSKGLAASLVVKLAGDGGPALDMPIANLGTSLRLPSGSEGVTLADVLSHRVGLPHNAWDDRLEAGEDPHVLRAGLAAITPVCPPATCHSYQNIAFDTATEVVEGAAQGTYAAAARTRLFAPLGMTSASTDRAGLERARSWARPHRFARRPTTVNDIYYRIPAAGGVNSSISDLVRWMRAQMGAAPAVLSPAMLQTLHAARVPTTPRGRRSAMDRAMTGAAYGLGWRSFTYAGHHLVGHRGTVDGYGSLMLFDPAGKSGIVMLWNSNWHRAARLQLEFFDMLYALPPTDWLELKPRDGDAAVAIRPALPASLPPAGPAPRATSSPPRS